MDPNAARATMIEKANTFLAEAGKPSPDDSVLEQVGTELAEAVHDLDEWLRMDGFPPEEWKALSAIARGRAGAQLKHDVAGSDPAYAEAVRQRKDHVDVAVPQPVVEGLGKEQDDQRPRRDGGVCGHPVLDGFCPLDRGHEGDHTPQ